MTSDGLKVREVRGQLEGSGQRSSSSLFCNVLRSGSRASPKMNFLTQCRLSIRRTGPRIWLVMEMRRWRNYSTTSSQSYQGTIATLWQLLQSGSDQRESSGNIIGACHGIVFGSESTQSPNILHLIKKKSLWKKPPLCIIQGATKKQSLLARVTSDLRDIMSNQGQVVTDLWFLFNSSGNEGLALGGWLGSSPHSSYSYLEITCINSHRKIIKGGYFKRLRNQIPSNNFTTSNWPEIWEQIKVRSNLRNGFYR